VNCRIIFPSLSNYNLHFHKAFSRRPKVDLPRCRGYGPDLGCTERLVGGAFCLGGLAMEKAGLTIENDEVIDDFCWNCSWDKYTVMAQC